MYFSYFVIISPWKRAGPFIWTNLSPSHPRMLCAKFGGHWLSGSGEDVLILSMYLHHILIISPLRRSGSFIWSKLNSLHPRMIWPKFGWNWPSGSGKEDENVKSLQTDRHTDRQTTDDRWSEKFTWAFSSGELNKRPMGHIAHLRKQFKSINTYDYIITLIKRRKKKHFMIT